MDEIGARVVRLPALAPEVAAAWLRPPYVARQARVDLALAQAAATAGVPLLLCADAGERPVLVARALHATARRTGAVWSSIGAPPASDPVRAGDTLIVDLDALDAGGSVVLEALLDDAAGWIVGTTRRPDALAPPLRVRFGGAVLPLAPLAARRGDVGALASEVLRRLAARAGRPAPELAPEALALLDRHPWTEGQLGLEAIVARAFLLTPAGEAIETVALDVRPPAVPVAAATPPAPAGAVQLVYLLAELAHELRNPLVTVKTFAQQLPALLEDAELRMRFAELTDEAVTRMDALLENVLDFARLEPPRIDDVDVASVLEGVLGEVAPALEERNVMIRRVGSASARCACDRAHLSYALRNLLLGIAQEMPPRHELVVDASVNGEVRVRFGTGGAVSRLRELAAPDAMPSLADPSFQPLAFTLARSVLERVGGVLGVTPEIGGEATVSVRLPPAASQS